MKILHFTDTHYDEKNCIEIQKCMDFMIKDAIQQKPDVIICSGDVTNSEYLGASTKSARSIMDSFRRLSDIAPVAVVIGTPSHDGQTPELLEFVSGRNPIYVSTQPEQIYMVGGFWKNTQELTDIKNSGYPFDVDFIVSQTPAPTKEHWKNKQGVEQDNFNIGEAMGAIFTSFGVTAQSLPGVPHILNGHFSVKGSKLSETQLLPGSEISIGSEVLAAANADLYCLGHIHMRQSYQIAGKENCFHAGSTWRKNFGERNEDKGFYIHKLNKKTLDGSYYNSSEFIKTPTREMFQADFNIVKSPEILSDVEDFSKWAMGHLIEQATAGACLKIKIIIYMDDIRLINQSKLKRLLLEAGASDVIIEIDRVRRETSRDEEIIKAVSLPEKVKALENYQSQPAPDGVMMMLEKVETLNESDLINFALKRIQ